MELKKFSSNIQIIFEGNVEILTENKHQISKILKNHIQLKISEINFNIPQNILLKSEFDINNIDVKVIKSEFIKNIILEESFFLYETILIKTNKLITFKNSNAKPISLYNHAAVIMNINGDDLTLMGVDNEIPTLINETFTKNEITRI